MIHELWYTSAPRGLDLGSSGYCTVKATRGMSPLLREQLERISQYRHAYPPGHPRAGDNPVIISSVTATLGSTKWHILSRICDAGADHTNRTNFFAHHIAYDAAEGARDPAWLASQFNIFEKQWDSRTEELEEGRNLPKGTEILQPCAAWRAVCGDAGWAGAVADAIVEHSVIYLISDGTRPLMPLITEVASLLPKSNRTELTFSTLYQGMSSGLACQLRCVAAGSEEAKRAAAGRARIFDLSLTRHGKPPESPRVTTARTGVAPEPAPPAPEKVKVDTGVPTGFAANQPAPAQPPARDTTNFATKPLPKKLPASAVTPTETPESDPLRTWLPLITGLGGVALASLVLVPFVISYHRESTEQKQLVEQRVRDIGTITRELAKQKAERTTIERDRDDVRTKREQAESSGRIAKDKSDHEVQDLQNQIAQLKKQHEDAEALHKSDEDKFAALEKEVNDAIAARKDAESQALAAKNVAPPPPLPTISRLPDANAVVRLIDYIPAYPLSIEIQGAPGFRIIPKPEAWEVQHNDVSIAILEVEKFRTPLILRFKWIPAPNRTDDLPSIRKKLEHASLRITIKENEAIVLPLYYTIAPSKEEGAQPQQ